MRIILFCAIAFSLTFSGCRKVFEKPSWDTDVKAPLIRTSMGIRQIIRDTARFRTDRDNGVRLVDRELLYDLNVDSLVSIDVKPYTKNVKLGSLVLDTRTVTRRVSLGQLALAMKFQGNATGDSILKYNGKIAYFPATNNIMAGPINVSIQEFFEEADVKTGTMTVTLVNQFPVDINRAEFEMNQPGGMQIAHEVFTNVYKGTSQSRVVDLANKKIRDVLAISLTDMDLAGGLVKIDTSNAIILQLKIENVSVNSATAVFPPQDVVNERTEISLTGVKNNAMLINAEIDEGMVEADAYSTAEDSVFFTYKIPSATIGADTFVMSVAVPPAPKGGTSYKHFSKEFKGYKLNLRGDQKKRDTVNTFVSHITGHIKYTGRKVFLSLQDSFYVIVKVTTLKPAYVKGYFGKDGMNFGTGSVDLDVFKNIESGTLNFDSVNVSLVVENGLGLGGTYTISEVKALNSKTSQSAFITPNQTNTIDPATENPYAATHHVYKLSNADARALLNVLPDKLTYKILGTYNAALNPPATNAGEPEFKNFAYKEKSLKPYLEMEVPLSVLAKNVVLSDTSDFLSDHFKTSVNSGTFSVLAENGFPLQGDLKMYFLDGGGSVVDSVTSAGNILAAPVDANNRVISKKHSRVSFYVDENRMHRLLSCRKVIFKVLFSTSNYQSGQYVKIYSDYSIDFKLTGDFNYTIE